MIKPDLLVVNANIVTVDNRNTVVEAMAVINGCIAAVGTSREMKALAGAQTSIFDAERRTILPGFIDAHCHLLSLAGKQMLQVDCSSKRVRSIDDIVVALKKRAKSTPREQWILGSGYDDTKLADSRHPTRWDLDLATRQHPVHIRHVSGHIGVANSKALQVAGFTHRTENPKGGSFDRGGDGELTGVCREEADFLFLPGIGGDESIIPPPTNQQMNEALQLACRQYNSMGITSVGDGAVGPSEIGTYQHAAATGKLTVRVYMMILDTYLPLLKQLRLRTGFGNHYLRIGPVKLFVDGAIAGRTAWLSKPYERRPNDYGIQTRSKEDTYQIISDAHTNGFQVAVHANGDRAITMVLDVVEEVLKSCPKPNHRHRIEHCTVVNDQILHRIKKLGILVLPFATYIYQHGDKMLEYGSRISKMFAHRSFLDQGIPVGGSSDNPCATQDPLVAIQTMATRRSSNGAVLGPEQRISVSDAIRIYCMGSAYASFEEHVKGSLEPGKLADFIVLEEDPNSVPVEEIHRISVLNTFVGGEQVYAKR